MSASLSELASLLQPEEEEYTPVINNESEENLEEELGEESQEEDVEETVEGENEEEEGQDVDEALVDSSETTSDESEAYFPETLDDLVSAYDGDEDSLKGITVASKKSGEKVSLGQVLANWEISESATRKSQEASEMKKALEQERQQVHATLGKKMEEQEAVLEALENLYKTAGASELEELRSVNPGEFAARKAEFMERDRILEQVKSQILGKKEEVNKEQQEEFSQNYSKYAADQSERMMDIIPEWRSTETFNKEFGEISSYMANIGFRDNEIAGVVDARVRKMARDAMLYNRIATTAEPKKKRIVKKPKRVARGGSSNSNVKDDAFKRRMSRAAKSKNRDVKKRAVAELIFNNS